jgi:hypothetical protein
MLESTLPKKPKMPVAKPHIATYKRLTMLYRRFSIEVEIIEILLEGLLLFRAVDGDVEFS